MDVYQCVLWTVHWGVGGTICCIHHLLGRADLLISVNNLSHGSSIRNKVDLGWKADKCTVWTSSISQRYVASWAHLRFSNIPMKEEWRWMHLHLHRVRDQEARGKDLATALLLYVRQWLKFFCLKCSRQVTLLGSCEEWLSDHGKVITNSYLKMPPK